MSFLSKLNRNVSPVLAGLAVLAVPALSQTVQAQSIHHPVIREGDHSRAVQHAEVSLRTLGYYHGAIDAVFGPKLLLAVKSFQGHYGLAQDGIVGTLTWEKLSATVGTQAAGTNSASPKFADVLMLRLGSHGPAVARLQQLLIAHGYHLAVDGDFGPVTYADVRNFQASHHLAVDGIVGPQTMQALDVSSNSASPTMEAARVGLLREGDSGPAVVRLQKDLEALGYSTGGAEGDFGPMTLTAVVDFQQSNGIPATGLVGVLTWRALDEAVQQAPPTNTMGSNQVNRGSISPTAAGIVGLAMKYQGAAYVFGGNSPATGFDCSGFVQWVYGQFGIALPRTSFGQWNVGTHVSEEALQPGDLVFFTTEGVFANHVGIYLGNGEFISAATPSQGVVVQSLSTSYFAQAYDGAVQVLPNS